MDDTRVVLRLANLPFCTPYNYYFSKASMDGHLSDIDLETSKFCEANQILLYYLPPYTSHLLQPLNVGVFGAMKATRRHAVAAYQHDNIGSFITK